MVVGEAERRMMKTRFPSSQERGSALLIVLGFLSFMTISAVSFAIYMRIERQASSNYRHTLEARHMLNAGLYRAIDEIDTDLRDSTVTPQYKFPSNWKGRVSVSTPEADNSEARVLSPEALSFMPGILVNSVRRYAVNAKWRKINMPFSNIGEKTLNEADCPGPRVGRYAYVCVNVSDMLNVNFCKGNIRDSETNRVGIGHLFGEGSGAAGKGKQFDKDYAEVDFDYETLQDFYACMHQRRSDGKNNLKVNSPDASTPFGSPFHSWLNSNDQDAGAGFNDADNQVLIADSIVKPEPTNSVNHTFNLGDPTDARYYDNKGTLTDDGIKEIAKQLASIPTLSAGDSDNDTQHFQYMLYQYLNFNNNKPYWKSGLGVGALYRPSVEMVPMVYQLIWPNSSALVPTITSVTTGTGADEVTTVSLKMAVANSEVVVLVQSIFPFKNWGIRPNKDPASFTVDASAYLVAVPSADGGDLMTQNDTLKNLQPAGPNSFKLTLESVNVSPMPGSESELIKTSIAQFKTPACEVPLYKIDKTGAIPITCKPGDKMRVALVIFAGVKQDGVLVDMAPGYWDPSAAAPPTLDAAITAQNGICDRLFFQTTAFPITQPMVMTPPTYQFQWTSLNVPDPRFNHKASNWVIGSKVAEETVVSATTKELLGKEGRDSDVYMFVSNTNRIFSPGEFGFLVRPVKDENAPPQNRELIKNVKATDVEDSPYMFRTVRLYDHTEAFPRDNVYDYFSVQSSDGTVPGVRVNPLSDIPVVLKAAIHNTPLDYYCAGRNNQENYRFNDFEWDASWTDFVTAWADGFKSVQANINASWGTRLASVYGDWAKFKWYSPDNAKTIFGTTLGKELHEIDRKMLMSYSLDSFSDRQQLFLYVIRAEKTGPTLNGSDEEGVRSLAGGRAVALVWRDPYPAKYMIGNEGETKGNEHDHRILFFKQLSN